MAISFEVVSPAGTIMTEDYLDHVVVRRREAEHDLGSEVAIYPHHGPLLMQTQACRARLARGAATWEVDIAAGVLEVLDDRVTLVVT